MSSAGRWDAVYSTGDRPHYGDTETYRLAADWLDGLHVEDWGCGGAAYRDHHRGDYLGIDGSPGWCDEVDDLATRITRTPGLMMRHVLEHNEDWRAILANAVMATDSRLVIVGFMPDGHGQVVRVVEPHDVPEIAIPHDEIDFVLDLHHFTFTRSTHPTGLPNGPETMWRAHR